MQSNDFQYTPRIFLIDDDPIQLDLLSKIIIKSGFEFQQSETILNIEEKINNFNPDILLLDVHLQNANGIDFYIQFQKKYNYSGLVVFLSGDTDHVLVEKSLSIGALDFIHKPYGLIEMTYKIKNLGHSVVLKRKLEYLHNKEKKEKEILKKFFPANFVDQILSGEISTEVGGKVQQVTSMIVDLRNSTRMAEYSEPLLLAHFLSDLFADLADLVFGEGGSIINFRGDGFLAVFGADELKDDDAIRCTNVSLRIIDHIKMMNQFKPDWLNEEIKVGIGIATGNVFVGNIGSIHRMDYTVIGDSVNLAARLENLTKLAKLPILIDGKTKNCLSQFATVKRVYFEKIRGKLQDVPIFALLSKSNLT